MPYTLRMLTRWPGALDCSLDFCHCFLFLPVFFCSLLCLSPLCASARLVVLKRVCYEPFKVKNWGAADPPLICLSYFFLDPIAIPTPCSHPGIGLHVTMVAGGHLDARRCGRVGSRLAGSRQQEEQGLVGNTVRGPE